MEKSESVGEFFYLLFHCFVGGEDVIPFGRENGGGKSSYPNLQKIQSDGSVQTGFLGRKRLPALPAHTGIQGIFVLPILVLRLQGCGFHLLRHRKKILPDKSGKGDQRLVSLPDLEG